SSDGGATWALGPPEESQPSSPYASDQIGATLARDGSPVSAWSTTFGLSTHAGLDPAVPNSTWQTACCGYSAGLATEAASGDVVLAWYSNATGAQGVQTQTILPSRGPAKYLPGSATPDRKSAVSPDQKVEVTARLRGRGVY